MIYFGTDICCVFVVVVVCYCLFVCLFVVVVVVFCLFLFVLCVFFACFLCVCVCVFFFFFFFFWGGGGAFSYHTIPKTKHKFISFISFQVRHCLHLGN